MQKLTIREVGRWLSAQLELTRPGHPKNAAMEGLRGLAIILVFLVHYAEFIQPSQRVERTTEWIQSFMLHAGMSGVDLFFVLSGYLIYNSIIRTPIQPFDYAKKRIRRIYPVFIFVLAVYVALSLAIPSRSKLTGDSGQDLNLVILNLLLLPLLPFIHGTKPIINATWSLAYEAFFYIAAPATIYLIRLRSANNPTRLITLLILSILGFVAFSQIGGNDRAMMFLSGALLAEAIIFTRDSLLPQWTGALALAAGITIVGLRPHGEGFPTISLFILFNIVCMDAFRPNSRFGKALSAKPLRWLGNISYSFYLIHGLLLQGFLTISSKIGLDSTFYAPIIPAFLFCVAGSLIVYLLIEKPLSLTDPSSKYPMNWPGAQGRAK